VLDFLTRDGWILLAARTLRGVAYGFVSVLLATYLALLNADEATSGVVLGVAMLSGAALNIVAARYADRLGRRRFLALSGAIMFASGLVLAVTSSIEGALAAALVGGLIPTAMETGPFLSVEQAILPQASAPDRRPDAFAWYNLVGSMAAAFGALLTGLAGYFTMALGGDPLAGYHVMFLWYAVTGLASLALALTLSREVELNDPDGAGGPRPLSPEGRKAVRMLTALFSVDSFAGGMVIRTFTALWFAVRFAPSIEVLGLVFFGANALSALSYLFAARLVRRLGLVKTMVYTHIPSNVLLAAMAFAPTFEVGVALFLARMSIAQMDVAPRQQFVVSVVRPHERTASAGITNTARNISQAGGPFAIGPVVALSSIGGPFVIAGVMKVAYDLALLRAFGRSRAGAPDS
jgi:MFS family permease